MAPAAYRAGKLLPPRALAGCGDAPKPPATTDEASSTTGGETVATDESNVTINIRGILPPTGIAEPRTCASSLVG